MECRICELCGHPNPLDKLECEKDGADISYVFPTEWPEPADTSWRFGTSARTEDDVHSNTHTARDFDIPLPALTLKGGNLNATIFADAILGRSGTVEPSAFAEMRYVSQRHAKVARQGVRWTLQDLGSTNGTFLNDVRLRPGDFHVLHDGDVVMLANVTFTVNISTTREEET